MACLFIFALLSCSENDDPKTVMLEVTELSNVSIDKLNKVNSADEAIAVIEEYLPKIKTFEPRFKKIKESNPQLAKITAGEKLPKGFEEVEKKRNDLTPKTKELNKKIADFWTNPKFCSTTKKLNDSMKSLSFLDFELTVNPKIVMLDFMVLLSVGIEKLNKTNTADEAIAVMNEYRPKVKAFTPRFNNIIQSNPQIIKKVLSNKKLQGFEEVQTTLKTILPDVLGLLDKMSKYSKNPKFNDTLSKLTKSMEFLN